MTRPVKPNRRKCCFVLLVRVRFYFRQGNGGKVRIGSMHAVSGAPCGTLTPRMDFARPGMAWAGQTARFHSAVRCVAKEASASSTSPVLTNFTYLTASPTMHLVFTRLHWPSPGPDL